MTRKWFVLGIGSAIVLTVAAVAAFVPAKYAYMALTTPGGTCTVARALDIDNHKRELTEAKDRILRATKFVRTDETGLELYETPYGPFWAPKGSKWILPFNFAEQAIAIYGTGAQAVQKGDVVLGCGANVGTFARFALDAGASKVVAIEPAPDNIECLRRNFPKEIAGGRLVIYPKGVWDKDDMLEFLVDPENQAADSFVIHRQGAQATVKLPLTTIDKMVAELGLTKVDYIKMDIEGAEVKAVQGARATIARYHPRLSLSVYHQPDHPVEVPKAVKAAWPEVKIDCGHCAQTNGQIRSEVLYFHQ
ncbi:MAG TPA: FkbM family methyltransferase [Bryobacteraceae bacterium]|nr:FkbM family methyltransferase [Bryobacteraceae bacterium]